MSDEIQPAKDDNDNNAATKSDAKSEEGETYCGILKGDPIYEEASVIVHWRDPVRTGILFGIVNFFYFLLTWGEYSFLTLMSYLFLTTLLICFSYANYVVLKASWIQGKTVENPLKERFKNATFHVSRQHIDRHVDTAIRLANHTIDILREPFYCTDTLLSLKFVLYFYLLATLGTWFLDSTLVYLGLLGAFIWPRLYEEKKKEIDQGYGIAMAQFQTYYELVVSKLPPAISSKLQAVKQKTN